MKIMVRACILGDNVKYSGGNNRNEKVLEYVKGHEVFAVCPEVMGGLPIPRKPGEITDGVVRNEDGTSVDREYRAGAQLALDIAVKEGIDMAILQSRSPSCGVNQIYAGAFTGCKINGSGIFAQLLKDNGFMAGDAEDL